MLAKALNRLAYVCTIAPRIRALQRRLPEAKLHPAGSRYVCSPPVMSTDIDILVYTPDYDVTYQRLLNLGFKVSTLIDTYEGAGNFITWRQGKINLVVSNDAEFIEGFQTGTYICRQSNILDKSSRIMIHAAFRKNEYYPSHIKVLAIDPEIQELLASFNGPHGHALQKAYRAKHGLTL